MATLELDINMWAEQNFGKCQLGDARRTRRAVLLAARAAAHPDGSTPEQTENWADCKAAYRLFDQKDVTFKALCEPHWKQTRNQTRGTYLLIGDTTEIEFGIHREVSDLGPTGDGGGRGFFLHTSLMVRAENGEVMGLAGADLFHRQPAPDNETLSQRKKRRRESEVWGRVIDLVGPPPEDARFVHVLDAGADNFEAYCHMKKQNCGWVVRAAQKHRIVRDAEGNGVRLDELVSGAPLAGTYELSLRARPGQKARTATLEVRFTSLSMPVPIQKTPYMKKCGIEAVPMNVVEVREINAPQGVTPLHWVLLTSEPVNSFEDTWTILEWYEKRWLVEDYHKCLKTGCRVESRQYETSERLERVTGLLCVVAVRLLQLTYVARTTPDAPAHRVVPKPWLNMLRAIRKGKHQIKTVREFFRSLAMLGGFLGRKHDGEPGWIVIWRGFKKLLQCIRGAKAAVGKCG